MTDLQRGDWRSRYEALCEATIEAFTSLDLPVPDELLELQERVTQ